MSKNLPYGATLARAKHSRRPRKNLLPDFRTIRFEDKGQDFLWWTITDRGERMM